MTKRAWILVLEAGLCSGLSACTIPARIGGEERVAHSAEADAATDIFEQPSPYAVFAHKEKPANPVKSVVSSEALASRSPYASLPQPIEPAKMPTVPPPEPPPPEPPPPEPPLPEPPIPTVETSSTLGNATNMRQVAGMHPERPTSKDPAVSQSTPQEVSAVPNNANSSSPYAEIKRHAPQVASPVWPGPATFELASPYAATLHSSSISMPAKAQMVTRDHPRLSPYTTISSQPISTAVGKVSKQESLSSYAPTPTEVSSPNKEISLDSPDVLFPAKSEPEEQVQPAKFPEQPEMHVIHDRTTPTPPQADLDVEINSSGPDRPIARKGDEPPLLTAMRCFLDKRPGEALTWLKRYDEPNQELLIRLMPLMNQLAVRDLTRSDAQKVIEIMEELNPYVSLPLEGDVLIGKLCLCKRIKAFGDYEPFPEDHAFQPRDLVWIYAEVRNFTSERRDAGNGEIVFETRLKTTARITNSVGNHEWSLDFDRRYGPDRSRTLRHDYWDNLSFNVPDLPPGVYTLWLKVVDEPTGRFKEKPIDFQVIPLKGQ
jgi:hypothetical protein